MIDFRGYVTGLKGRWWPSVRALRGQPDSRSSFLRREPAFVHGAACLPSITPLPAVLIALMGEPVDGLFRRSQRDPDSAVLDHDGFFPMVGKHVRQPRKLLSTFQIACALFSFPVHHSRGVA